MLLPQMQENRQFSVQKPLSQLSEGSVSVPRIGASHWLDGKILTGLCNSKFKNNFWVETLSNNVASGLKNRQITQFSHTWVRDRWLYWFLVTTRYVYLFFFSYLQQSPSPYNIHFSWKSGQLHSVLHEGGTDTRVAEITDFNTSSSICFLMQMCLRWNRSVHKRQFPSTTMLE